VHDFGHFLHHFDRLAGLYQYAVKACDSAGCSGWRNAGNTTDSENGGNAVPAGGSSTSAPAPGSSQ
jgi:hypothetical protein